MEIVVTINRSVQIGEYESKMKAISKVFNGSSTFAEVIDWAKGACSDIEFWELNFSEIIKEL
jgi:hypothetical protein